jgi:hypothetical protein
VISRASSLSGTLIPPIAIGISVLSPNGAPGDVASVGSLAMVNLLIYRQKHSVFGLHPKGGKAKRSNIVPFCAIRAEARLDQKI